ncbi:MAG: M48 family metalloprotease [Gemmatimonadota bacterium]
MCDGLRRRPPIAAAVVLLAGLAGPALTGCAVNPATGETQLALIGEEQEIEMGRQAAAQVEATIGLYEDAGLQGYVGDLGVAMARRTERPDLPWSVQVVDDPSVNAFALPGGFLYVTRGILSYFNSEAELASVLGHEIGHVTARHAVEQMSRQQLAALGLGVGSILFEEVREVGGLLGTGLGLLFLEYGRDDERQADELGVRYMFEQSYDPREAIDVFQMLERHSGARGGGALPGWLSTHPAPEDRIERIQAQIATLGSLEGTRVGRDPYLGRLDGLVFGPDPRNGYFEGALFLHPALRFQIRFPQGWERRNLARVVGATSPAGDAIVQLSLSDAAGHAEAASRFFSQEGVQSSDVRQTTLGGFPATIGHFVAQTQDATLEGLAAFLDYDGWIVQLLGYTPVGGLAGHAGTFGDFFQSFARLRDPAALAVQPMRIELIALSRPTSIAELARQRGSPVDAATLAILNGVTVDEAIETGQVVKWVEGEAPPGWNAAP